MRVDVQCEVGQAELFVERPQQLDDLGVDRGVVVADGLDAELVVHAVAAGLGAVVAEDRA